MTSPTRFIKRLASHQAPREAVVRQNLADKTFSVTFYKHGEKQQGADATRGTEREAVDLARAWVAKWEEDTRA